MNSKEAVILAPLWCGREISPERVCLRLMSTHFHNGECFIDAIIARFDVTMHIVISRLRKSSATALCNADAMPTPG